MGNLVERLIKFLEDFIEMPAQVCPKCEGTTYTRGTYCSGCTTFAPLDKPTSIEHIHIKCAHCTYIWPIATADKVTGENNSK